MKIIFYIIIIFFLFNLISNNKKDKTLEFLNKLDKYKNEYIISEIIDINSIDKINSLVFSIFNNDELYKYDFDVLNNIINNINNSIINKKKTKILDDYENNILDNFEFELSDILYNCRVKSNSYYRNINRNKSIILVNKIQPNDN